MCRNAKQVIKKATTLSESSERKVSVFTWAAVVKCKVLSWGKKGHCSLHAIVQLGRRWRCNCCEHRKACDQTLNNRRGVRSGSANISDCFIMWFTLLTRRKITFYSCDIFKWTCVCDPRVFFVVDILWSKIATIICSVKPLVVNFV